MRNGLRLCLREVSKCVLRASTPGSGGSYRLVYLESVSKTQLAGLFPNFSAADMGAIRPPCDPQSPALKPLKRTLIPPYLGIRLHGNFWKNANQRRIVNGTILQFFFENLSPFLILFSLT